MSKVELAGITKFFGKTQVLDDCSLKAKDQEFLVLVGPSGCGKSTLLRIIAGLEDATSGTVRIGEKDVGALPPKDRDIAMVFQNYALYPHMNVYKNMSFGLRMRGYKKDEIESRVLEAAKILEIEHLLKRRPAQLSGGQRQRVAMGRAIVRKPAAFLFDEPLSNLDAKLRTQMRTEIKRLHQRISATTIYVTHDQVEAMTLADRIAVIKDGVILQHDTPDTIYNRPANRFVAEFIGSPQMNFVEATLEKTNEGYVAKFESIAIPLGNVALLDSPSSVDLGIRPEQVSLEPFSKNSIALECVIKVTETLGPSVVLVCDVGKTSIVAIAPPQTNATAGQTVPLYLQADQIKIFDKESGTNLLDYDPT
jgi:multiple sugar transport system ATP-binding protein